MTFEKVKTLFEDTFKVDLGDTDIDIEAKELIVEISGDGLKLSGDLTIYGKEVKGKIVLSRSTGLSLTASTPKWEVDDDKFLVIENAEVSFFVGKNTPDEKTASKAITKTNGWFGGLSVKGTFTFRNKLKIAVMLQIIRTFKGQWGYVVSGQVEAEKSLADLLDFIPRTGDLDINLKKVWLVASNIDYDPSMLPPDAQSFPVKKGKSADSHLFGLNSVIC